MDESQHFYHVGGDVVDQDIVGMNHRLARAGDAAGTVDIGVVGQALGGVGDQFVQLSRRHRIAGRDIFENVEQIGLRLIAPNEGKAHLYLSMIARALTITSS